MLKMVWKTTAITGDPEQRQAVADEHRRAEQELAAADRQAEHDDAGTDDAKPFKPSGRRRNRQFGGNPGVQSGPGFSRQRRHARESCHEVSSSTAAEYSGHRSRNCFRRSSTRPTSVPSTGTPCAARAPRPVLSGRAVDRVIVRSATRKTAANPPDELRSPCGSFLRVEPCTFTRWIPVGCVTRIDDNLRAFIHLIADTASGSVRRFSFRPGTASIGSRRVSSTRCRSIGESCRGSGPVSSPSTGIRPTGTTSATWPAPTRYTTTLGDFSYDVDNPIYGAFEQDDWTVAPRLTLNFGLRYDVEPKVTNKDVADPLDEGPRRVDGNNFSPRFGFAYDVTGDGRTVMRGGAGRYYGNILLNIPMNEARDRNERVSVVVANPNLFNPLNGLTLDDYLAQNLPRARTLMDADYDAPCRIGTTIGVARQFGERYAAQVDFVHTDGNHLQTSRGLWTPSISSTRKTGAATERLTARAPISWRDPQRTCSTSRGRYSSA